jgi:group I intron endonuclease
MITGVYKITNPIGRIYIGESRDIEARWKKAYYKYKCKGQPRLYNSFKKYGIANHLFEIIEECVESKLKTRERYWQDFYDAIGPRGLNCKLTPVGEQKGVFSEETRRRISKATIGRPSWNKGKKGRKYPPRSETHLQNLRKPKSKEGAARMAEGHKKPILDINSGAVYPSRKDAALQLNKSPGAISYYLKQGLFKYI